MPNEITSVTRRRCSVCNSPELDPINVAILRGDSLRQIGQDYATSYSSVWRHKNSCIAHMFEQADVKASINLLAQLNEVRRGTEQILEEALDQRDYKLYLQAADRHHKQIELQGRLMGELKGEVPQTVDVAQQAQDTRALLLEQLAEDRANGIVLSAETIGPEGETE